MAQRTTQRRKFQQRQRQSGGVRRKEIVFNLAYEADRAVVAFLDDLPGGQSDYIREAIAQQIDRDGQPDLSDLVSALVEEIAALRAQVADLQRRPVTVAQTILPPVPDDPAAVSSSGIDMGRPRKRLARGVVPDTTHTETTMTPEEEYTMRMQLVNSIKHCTINGVRHDP